MPKGWAFFCIGWGVRLTQFKEYAMGVTDRIKAASLAAADAWARPHLYLPSAEQNKEALARQISRKLRLLRAHGLIVKVNHTHRYRVSAAGRRILPILAAARMANVDQLTKAA